MDPWFDGFPGYSGWLTNPLLANAMDVSRGNTVKPSDVTPGGLKGFLTPALAWGWVAYRVPMTPTTCGAGTRRPGSICGLIPSSCRGLEFQSSADGTGKVLCRSAEGKQKVLVSMRRPKRAVFDAQLAMVLERLPERADRTPEILTQVVPQYAYWSAIANLHPARTPWTIELTQVALHFSMLVCQRLKHILACPRPVEYSPLVQPIVLTPTYAALPSGHATEAYMFAKMMEAILSPFAKVSPVAEVIVKQLSLYRNADLRQPDRRRVALPGGRVQWLRAGRRAGGLRRGSGQRQAAFAAASSTAAAYSSIDAKETQPSPCHEPCLHSCQRK